MSRTAVIAGVGPGLGESLAKTFVDEGCQVGLFARSASYLESLSAELGDDALAVQTDITSPEQVAAGFERVREEFGPVDVLVNRLGVKPRGLSVDSRSNRVIRQACSRRSRSMSLT
jgi:NADP-dependent 3-hydroxy acid dehydrogenase YdfG